ANPALAELPESGEVAPDLRRVDVGVVRELLRGDGVLAHLPSLGEHLEIAGQPCGDAEGKPISIGEIRGLLRGAGGRVLNHADKVPSRALITSASSQSSETISPSSSTTGIRSRKRRSRSSSESMSISSSSNS